MWQLKYHCVSIIFINYCAQHNNTSVNLPFVHASRETSKIITVLLDIVNLYILRRWRGYRRNAFIWYVKNAHRNPSVASPEVKIETCNNLARALWMTVKTYFYY